MRKVGLVTFHDTANHGAALQAYATLEMIREFGYEPEIINYSNDFRKSLYDVFKKSKYELKHKKYVDFAKTSLASPLIYSRMKMFNDFYDQFTKRSSQRYVTEEDLNNIEDRYSAIVVGSDQVWSTTNNGMDFNYYLDFVKSKSKTMSYASSFGTTTLQDSNVFQCSDALKSICFPSVRERTGLEIYSALTGRDATLVLDPVFLLSKDKWVELIKTKYPQVESNTSHFVDYTSNKKYLDRFFDIPGTGIYKNACYKFGTSLRLKDFFDSKVKLKFSCDPIDFVYSLYNSNLLFTSSFHGVVLSIIFRKSFVVILSGNEGRDSRIKDLLDQLGLSGRIFHSNMNIDDIKSEIDYDSVHSKLEYLREFSINFFKTSLSKVIS
ncbi:conserved hypothetical protein [Vibrio coralliirubri]|uniref:polysaccharide pyruvyl transferase family protein n=1 Tax=Vibrio TaxID=662 RepID=UPI0006340A15|nr:MULTISPECIES: polysaccharide pyruvyl transferase family protein [Vibrio]PQJ57817.1 hypothetical protein BTO12_09985 [Vibrio splendidus]CDT25065.1 conserved hypothetical protein [Vibrio coralliirubri]